MSPTSGGETPEKGLPPHREPPERVPPHRVPPHRVLLLGLDGATFSILRPLVARGAMPHLARRMDHSAQAPLRSTDPYVTAPAWTSLVTGKRPDTHGIFDWSQAVPGTYARKMLDANVRDDQAFWEILASRRVPAGSLNLPLSYPPARNVSFCVADMFSPSLQADFVHPRGLREELLHLGYQLDLRKRDYYSQGFEPFLRELTKVMQARGAAIRQCLTRFPWQAAIVVFTETDRLQHAFWQHLDFTHPAHEDTPEQARAAAFFTALDQEIGQLEALLSTHDHLYLVSDHGFGTHKGAFYINDWLQAKGYLVLKSEPEAAPQARRIARGLLRQLQHRGLNPLQKLSTQLPESLLPGRDNPLERLSQHLQERTHSLETWLGDSLTPDAPAVDWSRTVAFADTPHGIQLNVRGREPRGIVEQSQVEALQTELAHALLQARDERTGQPIHAEVLPRDARFWGRNAERAPDLVYTFADYGYSWRIGRLSQLQHGRPLYTSFLAVETDWETGTHRPDGILIASGPDIQPGILAEPCQIWDILPTMLYHLDQAIPPDLEGRVLRELFREAVLSSRQERWEGPVAIRPGRRVAGLTDAGTLSEVGSDQQPSDLLGARPDPDQATTAEAVADHLRALGYMA